MLREIYPKGREGVRVQRPLRGLQPYDAMRRLGYAEAKTGGSPYVLFGIFR